MPIAHATNFTLTETDSSDNKLVITFDGTENGNLVANLTNIYVKYNSYNLIGNGSLYNRGLDSVGQYTKTTGTGQVSFNGLANNFIFSDTDFPDFLVGQNYI